MLIIGLTGGIGTGKDEAAKVLKRLGAKIIDADEVGHKLLKKDTAVYKKVLKVFGEGILGAGREIDRKKLGFIVFKSRIKLAILNKIIHPPMKKEFAKAIAAYRKSGEKLIVLNAAVLFEAGWDELVDKTILITAPKELRIKRLQKRGIDKQKALIMISSQWSDSIKKKKSDFIINNEGSLAELRNKIKNLIVHCAS